jgi:hypothetical protein
MRDVKSKLAREVNRLTRWKGHVFERRYDMAVVTEEEGAQVERLAYILANGVKENLVERVRDWPGPGPARRREEETVVLSPIPCWAHLSPDRYRKRVAALVESIEEAAALQRSETSLPVLGVKAILATDLQHRPAKLAKSPARPSFVPSARQRGEPSTRPTPGLSRSSERRPRP